MTRSLLHPNASPLEVLQRVQQAEREVRDALQEAARVASDPEERELYRRLAAVEDEVARALAEEEKRIEAEEFVRGAIDV